MSFSVSGSNSNNPFASLQSLWQQGSSASGTQPQSDPLSGLLAELDQQGAGGPSSTSGTTPSDSTAAGSGSTSPQFDPQTLQALLAQQASGSMSTANAASGGSAAYNTSSSSAGAANVPGNNLLEQLV